MKVLLIHQYFNTPDGGGPLRTYYLAKALVAQGIEVTVVTSHNAQKFKRVFYEGIEVCYLPVAYDNRFGFYRRIVSFFRFSINAFLFSKRIPNVSLCYAVSVPLTVGIAALMLKRISGIPYVFEVGDLWPRAPIELGFIRNVALQKFLKNLESRIYREAECVVGLSEPIVNEIKLIVPAKRTIVIHNMADTSRPPLLNDSGPLLSKYQVPQGCFVISYLGAIGFANGLENLIAMAHECARYQVKAVFIICGDGAELPMLRKKVEELRLQNVRFFPFTNRAGVYEILSITDACFISYRSYPVLETGSPHKYFDALAAAKIVLINFGGWIKSEVEAEGCGLHVDTGSIVEKVNLLIKDTTLRQQMQERSRKLAEKKYSREKLTGVFVETIKEVIAAR